MMLVLFGLTIVVKRVPSAYMPSLKMTISLDENWLAVAVNDLDSGSCSCCQSRRLTARSSSATVYSFT